MLKVGIVGATGYAGEELIDILLGHPYVKITHLSAKIDRALAISEMFPRFKGRIDLICSQPQIKKVVSESEFIFLALPHTISMELVPELLGAGKRVVDLSADYRLKDTKIYEEFYKLKHKDKAHLGQAVYGLPELYRLKIKNAKLVANPGCYPTCAILALAPLVAFGCADINTVIIDAKSGATGAGRKAVEQLLFSEINEDFKAYKVNTHQHMPEIEQELSKLAGKKLKVTFVPHLLPINRGILETIYIKKNKGSRVSGKNIAALYKKFYKKEPFVRMKEEGLFPNIKDVAKNNFCDIGIRETENDIIIIAAIDNLIKGASGQAVQNMNIMCGFDESTSLL